MRHVMGRVALSVGLLVMFTIAGCLCPSTRGHQTGEVPVPPEPAAYVPPPPEPMPVVEVPPPAPAPIPVLTPPPQVVPPAVAAKIQDLMDKYPGLFTFDKDTVLILFNSDITFDSGSAVVKPDAKAALNKLAQILNEDEAKDRRLTIIGHTDSDRVAKAATINNLKKLGKSADNMGLSEARAEAVAAVLQSGDIDPGRVTTRAKGATDPITDNRTPAGKARNRRVEIYLTPMSEVQK